MKKDKLKFESSSSKSAKKIRNKDAQQTIPFLELYENGMMLVSCEKGKERYAMVWKFENSNYQGMSEPAQIKKQESYKAIFNGLSPDIQYQEICINVPVNVSEVLNVIAPQEAKERVADDDTYAQTYFKNQENFIHDISSSVSDKNFYFALSYVKKSKLDVPHNILIQAGEKIKDKLQLLGSVCNKLSADEILHLLHQFYNPYDEEEFKIPENLGVKGIRVRDYIAPSAFNFKNQYIEMGNCYTRCFFAWEYGDELDDSFIQKLMQNQFKIVVSKQIKHIDKDIALKQINNRLRELEQERQDRNAKNKREGTDYIPLNLREEIDSCIEMQKTIKRTEELFDVGIYICVSAKTLEELEDITKIISGASREFLVTIKPAALRQEEALASIAPFANDKLKLTHYFFTSSIGATIPFTFNNNFSGSGFFYGKSVATGTPIVIDRTEDINGNGFIVGKSGSGKSLYAKLEINDIYYLKPNDRIIIIDPEREFVNQASKFNGQIIQISVDTEQFINPFDLDVDEFEKEESAIRGKTSLIESLMGVFKGIALTANEESIIDRCVRQVYAEYVNSNFDNSKLPTLSDFYTCIGKQPDAESHDLQLYLERYVYGSVNIFAHKTNIQLDNRITVFDLSKLSGNLRQAGLLIILDNIWKQVLRNYNNKISTWIYADEFQLYYDDNGAAGTGDYFESIWARCRKYGGKTTGITQNISKVVASQTASAMLQNSQCVTLLEQQKINLDIIKDLYGLSDEQASRLYAPKIGEGIIISKNTAIPFERRYPTGNEVYNVISTKFGEDEGK